MPKIAENARARKTKLIRVAFDVIATEGVSACTFRRLAEAANTSTRPFTHAFGTRAAMLREVAFSTWQRTDIDLMADAGPIERPSTWDCIDELVATGRNWLPLTPTQAQTERVYLEIVLYSLNDPVLHGELNGHSLRANAHVQALVEEGQRRGQLRSDLLAADLVMAFWSYQEGLAFCHLHEPNALSIETLARLWESGVRSLLQA